MDLIATIPAYQCEGTVARVVDGVRAQGIDVLVIDDGSTDATGDRARAAGAAVLRHPRNLGKGTALCSGFRWALSRGASAVLTLDADLQHDPSEIPGFARWVGRADLAVGRRALDTHHMPMGRLVGNRISTFFIGLFCRTPMEDTQCGFRLYSRRLLTRVPLRAGHFETETELLMRAQLLGLDVRWVPIATIYEPGGGRTHFDNVKDTIRVIRVVVASPWYPRSLTGR